MRITRQYIDRRKERPSHADYNAAHWFLNMVQRSTVLTAEEKAELRHDALHGKLAEARQRMEECVRGRMGI